MRNREISQYKIQVDRTASYFTLGNLTGDVRFIWMIFHGYGQRAPNLLSKFADLKNKDHYFLAPEGLSKFYWDGVDGRVVASWMTKADRYEEIHDQVHYLNKVLASLPFNSFPSAGLVLFAFSQGTATLWRWLLNRKPKVKYIILWAGWLPDDIDYAGNAAYLADIRIIYIHGTEDTYLPEERMQVLGKLFEEKGIGVEYRTYQGDHRVDREVLGEILKDIFLT